MSPRKSRDRQVTRESEKTQLASVPDLHTLADLVFSKLELTSREPGVKDRKKVPMEGEPQGKPERPGLTLPLKHGGRRVNVRSALVGLDFLNALWKVRPQHFTTLLLLAQGKAQVHDQDPEIIAYLSESGFLQKDARLKPELTDVLLSAYREGKEGPYLGNPFQAQNRSDQVLVDQAEEQIRATYNELFEPRR